MKEDPNFIDELVKKRLANYEQQAGIGVKQKLFWQVFLFNHKWLFALGTFVLLTGALSFLYFGPMDGSKTLHQTTPSVAIEQQVVLPDNQLNNTTTIGDQSSLKQVTNEVAVNIPPEDKLNQRDKKIIQGENSVPDLVIKPDVFTSKPVEIAEVTEGSSCTEIPRKALLSGLSMPLDSNMSDNANHLSVSKPIKGDPWFSVNIYAGPSYSNVFISGISSEYVDQRKTYESNKPGWSVGSDFKFHLDRWVLSTGINYSVYNQKRDYSYSYQEYLPDDSYYHYDSTWIWVHETPTSIIPVLTGVDSTWVEVYADHTVDNKGTNQVKYFEIPFMVGYVFNHNLFSMELNAGGSVGILNYAQILVPSRSNYNEIVETKQINRTMFNVMANATFYYHLNQKVSLLVSPYYKQSMQSIFNSNYSVDQRYGTVGVNFGVNILF